MSTSATEHSYGVPIHSNKREHAGVSGDGDDGSGWRNTPMLPKNRAIRYFQSEPNAPLVRAEIERHTGAPMVDESYADADDTIDSVDLSTFQNAHAAARVVAEQTRRRLQRQRQAAALHTGVGGGRQRAVAQSTRAATPARAPQPRGCIM